MHPSAFRTEKSVPAGLDQPAWERNLTWILALALIGGGIASGLTEPLPKVAAPPAMETEDLAPPLPRPAQAWRSQPTPTRGTDPRRPYPAPWRDWRDERARRFPVEWRDPSRIRGPV